MNIAWMLVLRLVLVFTILAFLTMDPVEGIVNITGYLGETIELRCLDSSPTYFFREEKRKVSWMYPCQNDCSDNSTYVNVANCYQGNWEYLSYGHQLVGNNDACENSVAYMRATEPGNFTYKCQEMSEYSTYVIREVTFMITITALDNSSMSPCLAKYVPSSHNLVFDFICRNYRQRDCLNEEGWENVFLQHNGVRIIPNIIMANKIVARIGLENISSISQYYCINQNHSSPCVVDDVTLDNPIAITPIVNRVKEGSDAIFKCIFKDGYESGERYEWSLSRHIEFSRISSTASSTLKISDVKFEDDGVIVRCAVDVNGTSYFSEAVLRVFPGHITSEALLRIRTEGGSATTASYSADTTNLLPLPTQLSNLTADSCKPIMMYFLIPVFSVLLIAAVMVLAVYCLTRDIPGRPSADATQEVVQI